MNIIWMNIIWMNIHWMKTKSTKDHMSWRTKNVLNHFVNVWQTDILGIRGRQLVRLKGLSMLEPVDNFRKLLKIAMLPCENCSRNKFYEKIIVLRKKGNSFKNKSLGLKTTLHYYSAWNNPDRWKKESTASRWMLKKVGKNIRRFIRKFRLQGRNKVLNRLSFMARPWLATSKTTLGVNNLSYCRKHRVLRSAKLRRSAAPLATLALLCGKLERHGLPSRLWELQVKC